MDVKKEKVGRYRRASSRRKEEKEKREAVEPFAICLCVSITEPYLLGIRFRAILNKLHQFVKLLRADTNFRLNHKVVIRGHSKKAYC